ncbi:MAG: efflux RND transporter permease subunit, partial [Victivallales bacterium]|nr:efflux RND transporter permease subunit [Victivallales bacterium]
MFRSEQGLALPAGDGKPYLIMGKFARDAKGRLIPDSDGAPFRLWRPQLNLELNPDRSVAWSGIRNSNDIWDEILKAGDIPGVTSAPKLQPIAARIVMLQSGMRAPMGVKIKGPDLRSIDKTGLAMEKILRKVKGVDPESVFADRIVGKPYLEIDIDRERIARYGLTVRDVQDVVEVAIGGKTITTTVEGRARYPVRVRYFRELRDSIESLDSIIVTAPTGQRIPLKDIADINYTRGPQMIKSEDTFLTGYLLFDSLKGFAETDVVENAMRRFKESLDSGEFTLPAGVSYSFAGNYENQLRARNT